MTDSALDPTSLDEWHRGDWMQTHSGLAFYPLDPAPEDIVPADIAHSLAMQCRYNGHVRRFYSVAEHCVLMSDWILENPAAVLGFPPQPVSVSDLAAVRQLALWALLHDAAEAYIGDMVRPLKINMPAFVALDELVTAAVARRFALEQATIPDAVKTVDTRILLDERAALLGVPPHDWALGDLEPLGVKIRGWEPSIAKWEYIARLRDLGVEVSV